MAVSASRRIAGYGRCVDDQGRLLLVRAGSGSTRPGTWLLPGGGIEHGEDPADAVVREVTEETGLAVRIERVREVAAEIVLRPAGPEHTDGVVFDLTVTGGRLRPERDGSSDRAAWLPPAEAAGLPLGRFAATALELPPPPAPPLPPPAVAVTGPPGPRPRPVRGQRFAAYGMVTDPAGRMLLTRTAEGYPGAGSWHLPGGGTDPGEQPHEGLVRELTEESGQHGRVARLQTVVSRHNPAALGPEGYRIDWHSVAAVFAVVVDHPTEPRVLDIGGSTGAVGWFTDPEVAQLPLTELAAAMVRPR